MGGKGVQLDVLSIVGGLDLLNASTVCCNLCDEIIKLSLKVNQQEVHDFSLLEATLSINSDKLCVEKGDLIRAELSLVNVHDGFTSVMVMHCSRWVSRLIGAVE